MTIVESNLIDQAGQIVLLKQLPLGWLKRRQHPDYKIDYFVEIVTKEGRATGHLFGLQLKSTATAHYIRRKAFVSYPLESKYIEYYVESVQQPVFLIVADVNEDEAYWIFMQKWARENEQWQCLTKPTVRIPIDNRLSDTSRLVDAVFKGEEYMRELRPSSVAAALAAEVQSLQEKDPRVSITLEAPITYRAAVREPLQATLAPGSADPVAVSDKLSKLVMKGIPASFGPGEVKMHGSPLFDRFSEAAVIIECTNRRDCDLLLLSVDSLGHELESVRISGTMSIGKKGGFFNSDTKKMPLLIELTFEISEDRPNGNVQIGFHIDSSIWAGSRLSRLPYFDRLASFARSLDEGIRVRLVCEIEGYFVFSANDVIPFDEPFVESFKWYTGILEQAAAIFSGQRIDPTVPDLGLLKKQDVDAIVTLYHLIAEGQDRKPFDGMTYKIDLRPKDGLLDHLGSVQENPLTLKFEGPFTFDIFGESIAMKVRQELIKIRFVGDVLRLRRQESESPDVELALEFIGESGSELITTNMGFRDLGGS